MRAALALCLLAACRPPLVPLRAEARAAVLTVAQGVKAADAMCAGEAMLARNVELADACAREYARARLSLLGAEKALDDEELERAACEAAPAAIALGAMVGRMAGKPQPAIVDAITMGKKLEALVPCGGRHDAG